jgi:hypothetical protein
MTTRYEYLLPEMVILYYHFEVVEVVVELVYYPYSLTLSPVAAATAATAATATAVTATAVPSTVDRGFRNNDETPQTIHQIFDGCVQRCSSVQRNQDMFREFLTNELPPLFAKFEKLCRGKHD